MSWFRKEVVCHSGKAGGERCASPPEQRSEEVQRVALPSGKDGADGESRTGREDAESGATGQRLTPSESDGRAACPSQDDFHEASPTPTLDEQDRCGPERVSAAAPRSDALAEDEEVGWSEAVEAIPVPPTRSGPRRKRKGRRLEQRAETTGRQQAHTPEQRLLLLDTWRRSGLPAKDFAALVGVSTYTLYNWKRRFEDRGPEGLMDQARGGRRGSRLPELTKRTILMLKQSHPEWGCQRISDLLVRGPALPASPSAVSRVLHEAGSELVEEPTRPHPEKVRRFERAKPNQLWQTDLFTFVLKRQNRRVYLVAFMDDHSRFLVSYGLHASQSAALVLEVLEAGIASYGPPEEILTDNGPQYVTWRGKSRFTRHLEKRGIRQIVSKPKRPQTLGKIERFWGTLWREFLETAVFLDLEDARRRVGLFIDYYNFQRCHRGLDGLVPADRFFGVESEVLRTLKERVAANALELARHGRPQTPFYVTGQLAGQSFSVHGEGQRLILTRQGQEREEIELARPAADATGVGESPTEERGCPEAAPATTDSLPQPLCPDGSPRPPAGEPACNVPPPPGQSSLTETMLAPSEFSHSGNSGQADDAEGSAGGDQA
jgi:transposase InsO family protein